MPRVLVTGATGFIAGHVVRDLLAHGYEVWGTSRSTTAPAHLEGCRLVVADLLSDDGWDAAMEGMDGVFHMASPLPISAPDDEQQLIRPAVEGTRRVLEAAHRAGVRRVVLTSSTASIISGNEDEAQVTEEMWSDLDRCSPYPKSKTLAEREAWSVAEALGLELSVINPCLVVGPLLQDRLPASMEPIRRILAAELPALPKLGWTYVDVRDVAAAHRRAFEVPEAAGERFIVSAEALWMQDLAKILARRLAGRGLRIPTWHLPYPLLWLASLADPTLRQVLPSVGRMTSLSNEKAQRVLGFSPRPVEESVVEAAESLLERGLVSA